MNRTEALEYLTRCADNNGVHWSGGVQHAPDDCPTCHGSNDAGWLRVPGSRYGWTSAHCAPAAYRHAVIRAWRYAEPITRAWLDESMRLVVNDSETPESDFRNHAAELAGANVDAMVAGYLECQLWAQSDYDRPSCACHADDPQNACHNYQLDANYSVDDVAREYIDTLRDELADIVLAHPLAVRMYLSARERSEYDRNELFGHDFYLTREHHGAGFWDRGLGELGRYLTDVASAAGSANELSDNGNGELTA